MTEGELMSNDKPDGYVFGRPTEYRQEMIDQVVPFMEQGYSKEALAGHLNVCKETLYTWMEKYPDFMDAVKLGTTKSQIFWEKIGIQGIILGRSENFAQGAWAFNMKNRFKWDDNKEENSKPIVVNLNYDPEIKK